MVSTEIIHIFLENFEYIDDKGKRSGCLFFCFNNKNLTQDLEQIARDLRKDLNNLLVRNQKDSLKCEAFVNLIGNAFLQCELVRMQRAPWNIVRQYYVEGRSIVTEEYEVKTPYKPSKFEKELIYGLSTANQILDDKKCSSDGKSLANLKKTIDNLLQRIRNYSPEEIRVNVSTLIN